MQRKSELLQKFLSSVQFYLEANRQTTVSRTIREWM